MKMCKLFACVLLTVVVMQALSVLSVAPTTELPKVHAQGVGWLPGWPYRVKIVINNTKNPNTLSDYQVLIVVNTRDLISQGKMRGDCGDVRFTDEDGATLLPYWIDPATVNSTSTRIWVRVPYIPGGAIKVIYMYYGNSGAASQSSGDSTFILFDDFLGTSLNTTKWSYAGSYSLLSVSNGVLSIQPADGKGWFRVYTNNTINVSDPIVFEIWSLTLSGDFGSQGTIFIGLTASTSPSSSGSSGGAFGNTPRVGLGEGDACDWCLALTTANGAGRSYSSRIYDLHTNPYTVGNATTILIPGQSANLWIDGKQYTLTSYVAGIGLYYFFIGASDIYAGYPTIKISIDRVIVRKYASPAPTVLPGSEETAFSGLPADAAMVRHWLVYSPNSTQFTHSFSTTSTTTAGYTTSYGGDAWAWGVYANPYYSNGTAYPNTASLVSNATIVLPYSPTNVYKLSLWAKTSSTGSYRRLWIRVLNSAGAVVTEIANASIGTSWTNVTVPLNINDSKVSIWINATVSSTASSGEEIAVRGVKLFALNVSTTSSVAEFRGHYYNCTAIFSVGLTNSFLNSSMLDLLLRDRLVFNRTTYPGATTYVGSETLNNRIYKVYRISNANVAGNFYAISTLPNALLDTKVVSRGVETYRALVGEPISLVLPIAANATVVQTKARYTNIGNLTLHFSSPGVYTIIVNRTDAVNLLLGYKTLQIVVGYGSFTASLVDADGKPLDYETLTVSVKNLNTGAVKSLAAKASATVAGLSYGVHQIIVSHRGVPVCSGILDLWIGSNSSTVGIKCNLKRLSADYRGVARSVAWDLGKTLLNITSLNAGYPYARIRYLINGSGPFKLIINYYSYRPTAVDVKANVSISSANWDGNYLVISGSLGSAGSIVVADLYRLRVEAYDRLGNVLPVKAFVAVNGTWHATPVDLLLNPATYIVNASASVDGFQFFSYGDGYRSASRAVNISAGDATLKVFYRVPTRIEVSAYQVMAPLWQRLLELLQDEQHATVYIDGKALDYYGNGVPNRVVTVKLYSADGALLSTFDVATDASGYYRTPDMKLIRNATYRVEVIYRGDDVYAGSSKTYEFSVAALPVAPAPAAPTSILTTVMFVIAVAIVVAAIVIGIKMVRKTATEAIENEMDFVKRKRFAHPKSLTLFCGTRHSILVILKDLFLLSRFFQTGDWV